ncbi:MAG: hypothetical protein KKD01_06790, partial [Proteobacteria bacterium]|nr:hypothetical protein [Pseudomonadota bacterium]MBU1418674.1 hypothetical protein [Pseudomonadota bacterium]MBU1454420.1 hypothetical protein [Pseudomonadota bacterium]
MTSDDHKIIKKTHPFADKFVLAVAKGFGIAALLTLVISVIYTFWIGWAFSAKLRELLDSTFWSILVYIIATSVVFVWGILASKLSSKFVLGMPVFGELGGLPIHTFSTAIRARAQIKVELFERDQSLAKLFNVINVRILHD